MILEQHYLSNYHLIYNVNRVASSAAYIPSVKTINIGYKNPSYAMLDDKAFAWDNKHSEDIKTK